MSKQSIKTAPLGAILLAVLVAGSPVVHPQALQEYRPHLAPPRGDILIETPRQGNGAARLLPSLTRTDHLLT